MSDFLQMGHYAFYVWSAYAVTLAVMSGNVWSAWHKYRKNLLKASDLHRVDGPYDA